MAALDPSESLTPNSARALVKLRQREGRYRMIRRFWIGATAAAGLVAVAVMLALPSRGLCCMKPEGSEAAPAANNYKESGSPSAPVVVEIYTDFECPACAAFYRDTYPRLVAGYVNTGRIRIVHRDFPLPQHPHAKLAARYANAAGELGVYEAAFHRLFETQLEWSSNGNIEAALAPVLKPEVLARIRDKVARDTKAEESMKIDMLKGATGDKLTQTPSLVVVTRDGQRHVLSGAPPFAVLSAYLDEVAAQGGRR